MSAAVAITPASGSITHLLSVCRITCTGVDTNTNTGYDADNYPASPAVVAFFKAHKTGASPLISPEFSASRDGNGEWDDVIFPSAGTWTLDLVNAADGTTVLATAAVVVA